MNDIPFLTTDEFFAAMDKEDLEDQSKCSPRDYGKLRGIAPQLVYYHIRQGHVDMEKCLCGRSVVDIDKTDQYFKKGRYANGNQED